MGRGAAPMLALGLLAAALGAEPAWLHAKALLAQALLQQAWDRRAADGTAAAPWPGADTHPVARLRLPGHAVDLVVLAGDSGRTLAFGPGWAPASTAPGGRGTIVVSAHRDTHFAFLRSVRRGDLVELHPGAGAPRRYRVSTLEVVDSRRHRIATGEADRLLLVTCWPFDAVRAGGPLRYVLTAVPDPPEEVTRTAPDTAPAMDVPSPAAPAQARARAPATALRMAAITAA